jgi:hypothetical protein
LAHCFERSLTKRSQNLQEGRGVASQLDIIVENIEMGIIGNGSDLYSGEKVGRQRVEQKLFVFFLED